MIDAAAACRHCEEITWAEARNFAYGIRLLPAPKRRAMAALYAMARRIDDVGDGDWAQDRKLHALGDLHAAIAELEAGRVADPCDPVLVAVAHAADNYPIPVAALHEIVEGCELDVRGQTYDTMDDTVAYCRLVAGSVGRLSVGVFGAGAAGSSAGRRHRGSGAGAPMPRPVEELADDLGVALQLTNMLRDIAEDQRMGRTYLPETERERFGLDPGQWTPHENAAALVRYVAGQAVVWFERGLALLDHLDYRSRACSAAMAGIYRRLLARILADPAAPMSGRISVPAWEKGLVAARSLSGLRP